MNRKVFIFLCSLFLVIQFDSYSQENKTKIPEPFETNRNGKGVALEIEFQKGLEHYFPLMAIWIEDTSGNYIHPLYVAESIAKGVFEHGRAEKGKWVKGEKRIPAALPYWSHKRGKVSEDSIYMPTRDNPLPDAYTGATPESSFILHTKTNEAVGNTFRVLFEVNQSWDWNEYWYNSKFPGNEEYLKSAQPAVVYETVIDLNESKKEFLMEPIGHSHPYGATGELFEDLSTLTTALNIVDKIIVRVGNIDENSQ